MKRSKNPRIHFNNFVINQNLFNKLIYTDGSKMEGKCGCGVFLENLVAFKRRVNDNNSIYSAEACAIFYALKVIQYFHLNNVAIFSDSLSILKRLISNGLKSDNHPIIGDILRTLNEIIILENKKVFFFWIPSHVGIPGNDVADELAKDSIYNNEIS